MGWEHSEKRGVLKQWIVPKVLNAELSASNHLWENFEFLPKYIFNAGKKRGSSFFPQLAPLSAITLEDATEIELSDWLVDQFDVICKQTIEPIVTKWNRGIIAKKSHPRTPLVAVCLLFDDCKQQKQRCVTISHLSHLVLYIHCTHYGDNLFSNYPNRSFESCVRA